MVERLFILKNMNLNNDSDNNPTPTGQSFNTDDDDSLQTGHLKRNEENSSVTPKSNNNLLGIDNDSKRTVGFLTSPSIDSINDPEGSISDIPLSEKLKKKKQRRSTIKMDSIEQKRISIKTRPWYTKVDLTKPILVLLFICLIYLMWAKRDVWIPRLLTSNSRVKHTIQRNEGKSNTKEDSIINKDSSTPSTKEDNTINDNQDQNVSNEKDDDESETPTTTNKHSSQKLNLRVRRNKMSFTRDRQSKSNRHSKYRIIDDDDDDDDDDEDDDDNDENDEEISRKSKEVILPSSIHSSKKHHHPRHHHRHHQSDHSHKSKNGANGKTSVILRPRDDIVEQLRKLIKSHGKNKDFLQILSRETGLSKTKLFKLVQQKDFSVLTLDSLLSLLDSFDSTILIVPQ